MYIRNPCTTALHPSAKRQETHRAHVCALSKRSSRLLRLTLAISAVLHRSQGAYTQSHGPPRPNLCVPRARSG